MKPLIRKREGEGGRGKEEEKGKRKEGGKKEGKGEEGRGGRGQGPKANILCVLNFRYRTRLGTRNWRQSSEAQS